uniref:MARVEL domain-containing protein n=1 Tax=Laticauda laticaudata TaxID=8630 RepID=A0A8C5S7V2_LATLA
QIGKVRGLGRFQLHTVPLFPSPVPFLPSHLLQVFSIVVFGSIINEGYVNTDKSPVLHCIFNSNEGACNYGIAIGLLAFLACTFFLVMDLYFQQISSVKDRKRLVLMDLGFSGMSVGMEREA